MSKKRVIIISLIAVIILVGIVAVWYLFFKPCEHQWKDATCENPVTCNICGEVAGNPLGHQWKDATCTEAKTCSACGITEGEALGHQWKDATCTEAKTCSVCATTEGEALGHQWKKATYSTPKTCTVCGKTEGSVLTRPSSSSSGNTSSNTSSSNNSQTTVESCIICERPRVRKQTQYCTVHACSKTNCPYIAKNVGDSWGGLCEFHSCRYPGCLSVPIGGSNYCGAHNN